MKYLPRRIRDSLKSIRNFKIIRTGKQKAFSLDRFIFNIKSKRNDMISKYFKAALAL